MVRVPAFPIQNSVAEADTPRLPSEILRSTAEPRLRLAIFAASSGLDAAISRMASGSLSSTQESRCCAAVARYIARGRERTTPFGLFASVGFGTITDAEQTAVRFNRQNDRVRVKPDSGWLGALVDTLTPLPSQRPYLPLRVNSRLERYADHLVVRTAGSAGSDQLFSSVKRGRLLDGLFRDIGQDGTSAAEISRRLMELAQISAHKADGIVSSLQSAGFLQSALLPAASDRHPMTTVVNRLSDPEPTLQRIREGIDAIDGGQVSTATYERAVRVTHSQRALTPQYHDPTLQFEAYLSDPTVSLPKCLLAAVGEGLGAIRSIIGADEGYESLCAYQVAFEERYGWDAAVPVLEALDDKAGLGSPPGYVNSDASRWPGHESGTLARTLERSRVWSNLILECIQSGEEYLELNNTRLAVLSGASSGEKRRVSRATLWTDVFLTAPTHEGVPKLAVNLPYLTAGGRAYGRFLEGAPPHFQAAYRQWMGEADANNAHTVFAELTYLPDVRRMLNVARSYPLRSYEVSVDTPPSPGLRQLPLEDLHLCVIDGRLSLWSKELSRIVVIEQGHMLSPRAAPDVCRLLLEVSQWGRGGSLEPLIRELNAFAYVPRLLRAGVIWRYASWCPTKKEVAAQSPSDLSAFAAWRQRWRVPRIVWLAGDDQRRRLDLDRPADVSECLTKIDRENVTGTSRRVVLQECEVGEPGAVACDEKGQRYLAEFVVPFRQRTVNVTTAPSRNLRFEARTRHLPGDSWHCVSLYVTPPNQRRTILDFYEWILTPLRQEGQVLRWFFVRYRDPRPHLRLRILARTDASEPLRQILAWCSSSIKAGQSSDVLHTAYEPEEYRYGGPRTMPLAEELFCRSSERVVEYLRHPAWRGGTRADFPLSAICLDQLLTGYGLSEREIGRVLDVQRVKNVQYGDLYRENGVSGWPEPGHYPECGPSRVESDLVQEIRGLDQAGLLTLPLNDILVSLTHMHMNRLWGPRRDLELVTYYYAWRRRLSAKHHSKQAGEG